MTENDLQDLISKFLSGRATQAEQIRLHDWYDRRDINEKQHVIFTQGEDKDDIKYRLYANLTEILRKETKGKDRYRMKRWLPYAAALVLMLSVGVYLYLEQSFQKEAHYTKLLQNDVGPGGNHAILKLGDGRTINLDTTKIGTTSRFNGMAVTKTDEGVLALEIVSESTRSSLEKNTIRTPKGGHYKLKLPDGTQVWLNASSSIEFPAVFADQSREIYLQGEAFFEVAQLTNKDNLPVPFVIRTAQQQIQVLGTRFNVTCYPDEIQEYTTLSEGSVRVSPIGSGLNKVLKPGEQSVIGNGKVAVRTADLESALAWKNGDFIFNHENLYNIMKKIERWYDVEVVYENVDSDRTFSGAISRSRNLSEVLQLMELSGQVKFKIEGRRVLVMT